MVAAFELRSVTGKLSSFFGLDEFCCMPRKIDVSEVEIGMHVVSLGGSRLRHPFGRREFCVESERDLDRIAKSSAAFVMIDESRGRSNGAHRDKDQHAQEPQEATPRPARSNGRKRPMYRPVNRDQIDAESRKRARAIMDRSRDTVYKTFDDLLFGWAVDVRPLDGIITEIVSEVRRDARALFSVTRVKKKDDYTFLHSVAVCTMMVAIAHRRGFERQEIREVALAGLLLDIGKIGTPDDLLKKPGALSDEELKIIRDHPEHGHSLLYDTPGIGPVALDVCLHHHERMDGSGYPFGLKGNAITLNARIGAVCDVFDALTSNRAYKKARSEQKALNAMWSWEGQLDRTVMLDLMHVMHIFAEGLLVRLSNDKLAVTQRHNPYRKGVDVLAVYSIEEERRIAPEDLVVARNDVRLRILSVEDPADWGLTDLAELKVFDNTAQLASR
ncbi:MAG: HD-GYP domain-containing protein [Pseudomonadota bacterium]